MKVRFVFLLNLFFIQLLAKSYASDDKSIECQTETESKIASFSISSACLGYRDCCHKTCRRAGSSVKRVKCSAKIDSDRKVAFNNQETCQTEKEKEKSPSVKSFLKFEIDPSVKTTIAIVHLLEKR
uniref:Uncharacterized protein n=1 Tax=Romanomermis culicivorax TaxID=13658 RepID=A0A915IW13_ROMCU